MIANNKEDILNIIANWGKVDHIRELTDAVKCELSKEEAEFYYDGIEKANLAIKILQNNNYLITGVKQDDWFSCRYRKVSIKL